MTASAAVTGRTGLLSALWAPGGLAYLAACVLALAVGLWPEAIRPAHGPRPAPLPTLQALAAGQVAFLLVIHPIVFLSRRNLRLLPTAIESGSLLLLTVPLYMAAAWLADAAARDVGRTVLCVAMLWPAAWAAGRALRSPRSRPLVATGGALLVAGLPGGGYLAAEFYGGTGRDVLLRLGPLTYAWTVAASRQSALLPEPIWPALLWLAVGVAGLLIPASHTKSPPADPPGT